LFDITTPESGRTQTNSGQSSLRNGTAAYLILFLKVEATLPRDTVVQVKVSPSKLRKRVLISSSTRLNLKSQTRT